MFFISFYCIVDFQEDETSKNLAVKSNVAVSFVQYTSSYSNKIINSCIICGFIIIILTVIMNLIIRTLTASCLKNELH